jgi:hypothetical protein
LIVGGRWWEKEKRARDSQSVKQEKNATPIFFVTSNCIKRKKSKKRKVVKKKEEEDNVSVGRAQGRAKKEDLRGGVQTDKRKNKKRTN